MKAARPHGGSSAAAGSERPRHVGGQLLAEDRLEQGDVAREPLGKSVAQARIEGLVRHGLPDPRPSAVPLFEARKNAKKALATVSEGKDPVQEKKANEARAQRERLAAVSFDQLAQQYIAEYAKVNKKAWQEDERLINRLLRPEFGSLNVKEITRFHVRSFLRGIAADGPVQANRAHACLRKIFNWAIKEEIGCLRGHTGSVAALECKDKVLVSAGYDTTVRVWDVGDQVAAGGGATPGRVGSRPTDVSPRAR